MLQPPGQISKLEGVRKDLCAIENPSRVASKHVDTQDLAFRVRRIGQVLKEPRCLSGLVQD
jgi:hypothetical protein